MLKLKDCPRCKGDMYTNRDLYGTYRTCLQCGFMNDVPGSTRLLELLEHAPNKKQVA